jgi:hypothetical protein
MSRLAEIAPRLAKAVEAAKAHEMRNLQRCSCWLGWRVVGHKYDTGGCMDLDHAKLVRDRFEAIDAAARPGTGDGR